ncbi:MAG TPA: hypothetical protein VHZ51_26165, partial [Ktedonobacteraceae bacterium]|nr:hypothetical protein [Ktedonobacteraceae bacterium]
MPGSYYNPDEPTERARPQPPHAPSHNQPPAPQGPQGKLVLGSFREQDQQGKPSQHAYPNQAARNPNQQREAPYRQQPQQPNPEVGRY